MIVSSGFIVHEKVRVNPLGFAPETEKEGVLLDIVLLPIE